MIFLSLKETVKALLKPKLWLPAAIGVVLSGMILTALVAIVWWILLAEPMFQTVALNWLFHLVSATVAIVLAFIIFPPLAVLVSTLFLDQVMDVVEQDYQPTGSRAVRSVMQDVMSGLGFLLVVLLVNIVVSPAYLVFLFFGIGIVIYYAVNGYLLGREYIDMVGVRWLKPSELRKFRDQHARTLFVAGLIIAVGFTMPVINLFMPVLATAFMTHLYHQLSAKRSAGV